MNDRKNGGLPEKCTLCIHNSETGETPACETPCKAGAIITGNLDDPNSDINRWMAKGAVERRPDLETHPNVFIIPFRR
jgi:Fe-S-cluster-containing dehydrogenase component